MVRNGVDEILSFGRLVAREASFVLRLVGRFAAHKVPEPPAAEGDHDRAVRERKLPFPTNLYGYIVAKLGAQLVEVAFFLGLGGYGSG